VINKNSTDLSPYILDIPIKEMVLTNGAWLKVNPNHADQILDQPINLSEGPVFGYLAYPLAVLDNTNNNCNWVLEPKYNTSLVITMPSYVLNNISVAVPYSWTIPYSPLMHVENNEDSSTYCAPASFDEKQLLPLDVPPISKNEPDYWQGFARFVWSQVTHGNY
jgi:hypothetical protein